MRNIFILLIFVATANSLSAQNMFNLFKNYLPALNENSLDVDVINSQLSNDVEVDPSLVYIRMNFYKNITLLKNNNQVTNGYNEIASIKYKIIVNRNSIVSRLIDSLTYKYSNSSVFEKCKKYLSEFYTLNVSTPPEYETDLNYDKNLDYFYRYLILTKNNKENYDKNIDYELKWEEFSNRFIIKILEDYKKTDELSAIDFRNLIDITIKYSALFEKFKVPFPSLEDYIVNYYSSKSYTLHQNNFFVQAGISLKHRSNKYIFNYYDFEAIKEAITDKYYGNIAELKDVVNFSLIAGYNIFLNEMHIPFSYLKISLMGNYGELHYKDMNKNNVQTFEFLDSYYNGNFGYQFTSDKYRFNSYFFNYEVKIGGFLKLSTPIVYLNDYLVLEGGIIGGYERCTYTFGINYNYKQVISNDYSTITTIDEKDKLIVEKKVLNIYYASPVVTLVFNTFNNLNAELYYHYNTIGFNFGVSF